MGFGRYWAGGCALLLWVGGACGGDGSSSVTGNREPIADAGIGGTVLIGSPVVLDGSRSWDPDGDMLSFEWSLVRIPGGSSSTVQDSDQMMAEFVPDGGGEYVAVLIVDDGNGGISSSRVVLRAEPPRPSADAGVDMTADVGSVVTLDGVASVSDGSGDYQVSWDFVSLPFGSSSTLTGSDTVRPSFVPDTTGAYVLELKVSTELLLEATDQVVVNAVQRSQVLFDFTITDAEYSEALERVIIASDDPPGLQIVDPVTGVIDTVSLPVAPEYVSVEPSGLRAAVAFGSFLFVVDLVSLSVSDPYFMSRDVDDLVFAGNGYVYGVPGGVDYERLLGIDLVTGIEYPHTGTSILGGTRIRLSPTLPVIYGATTVGTPRDIEKYDISGGAAVYVAESPYHGVYPMCGDLWLTDDGASIITRCGYVFHASEDSAVDMTYAGTIGAAPPQIRWADHNAVVGQIVTVRGVGSESRRIYIHDESLALARMMWVPQVYEGGDFTYADPLFVFYRSDGSEFYVLFDADGVHGLFAME